MLKSVGVARDTGHITVGTLDPTAVVMMHTLNLVPFVEFMSFIPCGLSDVNCILSFNHVIVYGTW